MTSGSKWKSTFIAFDLRRYKHLVNVIAMNDVNALIRLAEAWEVALEPVETHQTISVKLAKAVERHFQDVVKRERNV